MIPITIQYNSKANLDAIKEALKACGFRENAKINETVVVLPINILYHPNLLSINAALTILSIVICRLNRAGITAIDMNKIEVKQFNIIDYSTSINLDGVVLR